MQKQMATVWAPDGGKVKLRAMPSKDCNQYWHIPTGATLDVIEVGDEWTKVSSGDHEGYMMSKFLLLGDVAIDGTGNETVSVERKRLENVYDEIGDILGMRG